MTARDIQCVLLIVVLACALRLPHLSFPNETQLDELIYTDNALYLLQGIPFTETHPPLARIMFAEVARKYQPIHTQSLPMAISQSFGDFPYTPERTLVALFGIGLILLVYFIGRLLGHVPRIAMLPSLLIVCDNVFTLYGRTIHADTIMLFFDLVMIAAAFMLIKTTKKGSTIALTALIGIAAGFALSVKWIALGVFACVWLLLLIRKSWGSLIATIVIAALVYILLFASYLIIYFPNGGAAKNVGFEFAPHYIGNITFPPFRSLSDAIGFLPDYHKMMWATNNDPYERQLLPKGASPFYWPSASAKIVLWSSLADKTILPQTGVVLPPNARFIMATGNSSLWVLSFLGFFFNLAWLIRTSYKKRRICVDADELVLICGYLGNFLPFFFIDRPMYLYHYLTALVFLFLLTPYMLPRLRESLERLTHDRSFSYLIIVTLCCLVFVNFIYNIPYTYGTHSWTYIIAHWVTL